MYSIRCLPLILACLALVRVPSGAVLGEDVSHDYAEQILLDQPVIYYRFEEPDAEQITDREGASQPPHSGTQHAVVHGATFTKPGALAKGSSSAASFDGDDHIVLRHPSDQDVLDLTDSLTVELWINPSEGGGPTQHLLEKGHFQANKNESGGVGSVTFFLLYLGGERQSKLRFGFDDGVGAGKSIDSRSTITVGDWTHVVVTYDGTQVAIFINGHLDVARRLDTKPPSYAGQSLTLGALSIDPEKNSLTHFYRGQLDEVAVYRHVLDEERITTHYAIGSSQSLPENWLKPEFERDVLPILAANCLDCHGADEPEQGLDLSTVTAMLQGGESGPAIIRGDPTSSLLISMVESGQMPPDDHKPLERDEFALIGRWIAKGAPAKGKVREPELRRLVSDIDRQHWAFQKPVKPPVPESGADQRVNSTIDNFVLARLREHDLTFSPETARLTLMRRTYFDLVGLPPTPEEIAAYLADEHPRAYEQLIDRLLESQHYGERWARHWLDLAGYSDTREIDNDLMTVVPNEGIWRYRDWVIRAINDNVPYDRFLVMQLAGDELVDWRTAEKFTDEIKDHLIATGYLRHNQDVTDHDQYARKERFDVLLMTMQSFTSGVMGLTVACAQCHDHKYEPLPQRDYYRLMGAFMSAYNPDNWVKPKNRYRVDVSPAEQDAIDKENGKVNEQIAKLSQELEKLKSASSGNEGPGDAHETIQELQNKIAELQPLLRQYGKIQALWDVGKVPEIFLLRRGNHDQPGARLRPGFPAVLSDEAEGLVHATRPAEATGETTGTRLSLAQWLTRPDTRAAGLVARVAVNQIWKGHFGQGIVTTPGNLGRSGAPPSHPRLLDWLAADFIDHGWNLKRLHRQIMLSTTYRQLSQRSPQGVPLAGQAIDPENRLLWRQNVRRLEAEALRDSMLALSGRLDRTSFGPPVMLESKPDGMSTVKQTAGTTDHCRRSIYVFVRRNYPLKMLETFDTPIVPLNCTARANSASVLQSLTLLNDPFVLEHASATAGQIELAMGVSDDRQLVNAAVVRVISRVPSESEVQRCVSHLQAQTELYRSEKVDAVAARHRALADLCQMLMCTNEFLYVE